MADSTDESRARARGKALLYCDTGPRGEGRRWHAEQAHAVTSVGKAPQADSMAGMGVPAIYRA